MPTDNTLTMRAIADGWAVSNPTARKRLEGVSPIRTEGNSKHYGLRDVVLAFAVRTDEVDVEEMQARDRKDLADARLKEMKVARMEGEQTDAREVASVVIEILKRLADAVKAFDSITPKEKRALCKQLRDNVERTVGEIESCNFPDAD